MSKPPLFVLSSGHSGTASIAQMLDQHPEIDCKHERLKQGKHRAVVIPVSVNIAHRVTPEKFALPQYSINMINQERKTFNGVWAESNWRTFNMVNEIKRAWPNAKFIYLTRDGRASVAARSIHGGYYDPHHPHAHHLHQLHPLNGFLIGDMGADEWDQMGQFEKLCWMWGYVTRTIIRQVQNVPHIKVDISAIGDQEIWKQIHSMIGLPYHPVSVVHTNKKNSNPANRFQAWTPKNREMFKKWCKSEMDILYPGWE